MSIDAYNPKPHVTETDKLVDIDKINLPWQNDALNAMEACTNITELKSYLAGSGRTDTLKVTIANMLKASPPEITQDMHDKILNRVIQKVYRQRQPFKLTNFEHPTDTDASQAYERLEQFAKQRLIWIITDDPRQSINDVDAMGIELAKLTGPTETPAEKAEREAREYAENYRDVEMPALRPQLDTILSDPGLSDKMLHTYTAGELLKSLYNSLDYGLASGDPDASIAQFKIETTTFTSFAGLKGSLDAIADAERAKHPKDAAIIPEMNKNILIACAEWIEANEADWNDHFANHALAPHPLQHQKFQELVGDNYDPTKFPRGGSTPGAPTTPENLDIKGFDKLGELVYMVSEKVKSVEIAKKFSEALSGMPNDLKYVLMTLVALGLGYLLLPIILPLLTAGKVAALTPALATAAKSIALRKGATNIIRSGFIRLTVSGDKRYAFNLRDAAMRDLILGDEF